MENIDIVKDLDQGYQEESTVAEVLIVGAFLALCAFTINKLFDVEKESRVKHERSNPSNSVIRKNIAWVDFVNLLEDCDSYYRYRVVEVWLRLTRTHGSRVTVEGLVTLMGYVDLTRRVDLIDYAVAIDAVADKDDWQKLSKLVMRYQRDQLKELFEK